MANQQHVPAGGHYIFVPGPAPGQQNAPMAQVPLPPHLQQQRQQPPANRVMRGQVICPFK